MPSTTGSSIRDTARPSISPTKDNPFPVYIGYDTHEDIAWQVSARES